MKAEYAAASGMNVVVADVQQDGLDETVALQPVQGRIDGSLRQVEGAERPLTEAGDDRVAVGWPVVTQRRQQHKVQVPAQVHT